MSSFLHLLPPLRPLSPPQKGGRSLYVAAAGFEDRSLAWCAAAIKKRWRVSRAVLFKYSPPKGPNRFKEIKETLKELGAERVKVIRYDVMEPQPLENDLLENLELDGIDEVIVDASAMTKLLLLMVLCSLQGFPGTVRLIYAEANEYIPSKAEYDPVRKAMRAAAHYPSRGAEQVVRLRCLSSIRMQGQPLTLIAFTSFNEKLVSQMLGFVSPHRLILINGQPPRREYKWREQATYDIHKRLASEYSEDNPIAEGLLTRVSSSLDYRETVQRIEDVYHAYSAFERIICAATGSKMQTVGLFIAKMIYPDIHIEYPTPDSYYFKDMTHGVRAVHELTFPRFSECLARFRLAASGAQAIRAEKNRKPSRLPSKPRI